MYNLRVTVEKIEGFCDLPMRIGDYFEVKGSAIYIPNGGKICLWALQSLLPFIPAKQRNPIDENDWLPKTKRLSCPDPNGRVIFKIDLVDPKTGKVIDPDEIDSVANSKKFRIFVDESNCINCKKCENACAESHDGISRIKVNENQINVCRQCGNAPCVNICKFNALSRDKFGAIVVDETKCMGCGECSKICQFNAIIIYREKAFICDLCEGSPKCAEVCPIEAIKFEDLSERI